MYDLSQPNEREIRRDFDVPSMRVSVWSNERNRTDGFPADWSGTLSGWIANCAGDDDQQVAETLADLRRDGVHRDGIEDSYIIMRDDLVRDYANDQGGDGYANRVTVEGMG